MEEGCIHASGKSLRWDWNESTFVSSTRKCGSKGLRFRLKSIVILCNLRVPSCDKWKLLEHFPQNYAFNYTPFFHPALNFIHVFCIQLFIKTLFFFISIRVTTCVEMVKNTFNHAVGHLLVMELINNNQDYSDNVSIKQPNFTIHVLLITYNLRCRLYEKACHSLHVYILFSVSVIFSTDNISNFSNTLGSG